MTSNALYRSQSAAADVFKANWLPCYSPEYVSQGGKALWCYSKAYNGISAVSNGLEVASSTTYKVGDWTLGWAITPLLDLVYPINPINGNRHFVGISRNFEKLLGDWVFYPLATGGMRDTNELLPGTQTRIADTVGDVLNRLKDSNEEVLNPAGEATKFDYRIKTVHSSQVNAFAVPAGGMVIFTQIVKEIDAAIKFRAITETTVQFADGSKAKVDLSGVKLEDALAALLGHEMTHAASRHSIVAIFGEFARSVVLSVGRIALIVYLKSMDKEYAALANKPASELLPHERTALDKKEQFYDLLNGVFGWVEEKAKQLKRLFNSRTNEYEADVTGAYFAQQADYNPLGALYLQEILSQGNNPLTDWMHKNLEFLYTHPYGENRKRAIFAAISQMAPQRLKDRTTWDIASTGYDAQRSSPAIKFARNLSRA